MVTTSRGSFDYQTVLGTCDAVWPPGEYALPLMGNPVAGQHLWGGLTAGDRRLLPIRHFMNEIAGRSAVYAAGPAADFTYQPTRGYSGMCEVGDLGDQWGTFQPGAPPRFAFTTSGTAGRWREHDAFDLRLELVPEALQFATPDAEEPLVYLARAFTVTSGETLGDAPGRPVEGMVFHEQVYVRSGHGWVLTRHKRALQGIWIAFATRYSDGTLDWGQLNWGRRGWSFAIVIRGDGPPILAHRPDGEIGFDAENYPTHLDLDLGAGGVWGWRPPAAGGGRVPLPGPLDTTPRWSEGTVSRVGETREIVYSHTWAESYRSHLE